MTPTFDEYLTVFGDRYGKKTGYTAMFRMGWRKGSRPDGSFGWKKTALNGGAMTDADPQFMDDARTCYRQAYGVEQAA